MPVLPDGVSHPALETLPSGGLIAGVDEAGRGPWAGPVVAAAVILPCASLAVHVDDSKRLTPLQRERAFRVIRARACVGFGVVCADIIDSRNILQASLLAMRLALEDLEQKPDVVLIDGNVAPPVDIPCVPIVAGDQRSLVIASASIMAKVLRDQLMRFYHELEPRYAFNRHKGYGTSLHQEKLNDCGISLFHRRSFEPVALLEAALRRAVADAQNAFVEARQDETGPS